MPSDPDGAPEGRLPERRLPERRLHPLSILFGFGAHLRELVLPWLLVLVTARSAGVGQWELWLLLALLANVVLAVARYLSFRYRYGATEMVIRSGVLVRTERHIPYARIQNLDAEQGPLHRLLGVVEVRVETGGGEEPEGKLSVLPVAALDEMRARVLAARRDARGEPPPDDPTTSGASAGSAPPPAPAAPRERVLLHLPPRELVLLGLVQNRGVVVIAAALGLLWEVGLVDRWTGSLAGERGSGRGAVRAALRAALGDGEGVAAGIALAAAALVALVLVVRALSVGWALVRLHDFRLARAGAELRTEFGLLTRVTATVPVRRIQTLTVREGPLHQLVGRVSVRAETAGGDGAAEHAAQREWLAPILPRAALPAFVREVLPDVELDAVEWRGMHPRAGARAFREGGVVALLVSLPPAPFLGWWTLPLLAVLLAWAALWARRYVAHLGWGVTGSAVLFRSGWLWRQVTVARHGKIQAVAIHESPFDRRTAMAELRVDTAGAGDASHRVSIPYLPRETARELCDHLAARAAGSAFSW
jgi:putative membrane protein